MRRHSRRIVHAALLVGAAMLAGCDTIREATGNDKQPPDEFAVLTKAPLIIPPDFNLRPPKPGAAPLNQSEPTDTAQQSLFGADTATIAKAMPGNMSDGEKMLLASAGAQNADPSIRQDLAADRNKALQSASDDFTNTVLFWQKPSEKDESLNADAELAKSASAKQPDGAKSAAPDANAQAKPGDDSQPATIEKEKKKSSGGWFDWF
jgi:hypothetical protein